MCCVVEVIIYFAWLWIQIHISSADFRVTDRKAFGWGKCGFQFITAAENTSLTFQFYYIVSNLNMYKFSNKQNKNQICISSGSSKDTNNMP